MDLERGGEWRARLSCVRATATSASKAANNCLVRGYDRTGFFEIDTGEDADWTVQLTESRRAAVAEAIARLPGEAASVRRRYAGAGSPRSRQAFDKSSMRRLRRVKIVATLGPASPDRATIARLFEAGVDVFRINMSHADHDTMRERIDG